MLKLKSTLKKSESELEKITVKNSVIQSNTSQKKLLSTMSSHTTGRSKKPVTKNTGEQVDESNEKFYQRGKKSSAVKLK